MNKSIVKLSVLFLILSACDPASDNNTAERDLEETEIVEEEEISLFNGGNLNGWTSYGKDQPGEAWKVEDGVIYFDSQSKKEDGVEGGDLVTQEIFSDFHLKLEWKISENGNSGIMFHVVDDGEYSAPYHTGPEYQLLDNEGHPDGKITTHRTGDLYDLIESSEEASKPVGEWNLTEIIVQDGKLEFYLNGVNTVSTTMWDDSWDDMVAESKFKDMPGFAKYKEGKIALQDHGDDVWFRNITIKRL